MCLLVKWSERESHRLELRTHIYRLLYAVRAAAASCAAKANLMYCRSTRNSDSLPATRSLALDLQARKT